MSQRSSVIRPFLSSRGIKGLLEGGHADPAEGLKERLVLRPPQVEVGAQEALDRKLSVDQVWEERASFYPPGRVVTPQEVAELIAFLAAEESSGVSGEAIRVSLGSVW